MQKGKLIYIQNESQPQKHTNKYNVMKENLVDIIYPKLN